MTYEVPQLSFTIFVAIRRTLALSILSSALTQLFAASQAPKVLSVCDVLENLNTYSGKVISVRGKYHTDYHGEVLYGVKCRKKFVTSGYEWPHAIHIQSAEYYADEPEAHVTVPFKPENDEMARVAAIVEDEKRKRPETEIWLTVVGLLLSQESYVVIRLANGSVTTNGFGHGNSYPAELVVKTVKDLSVKQGGQRNVKRR